MTREEAIKILKEIEYPVNGDNKEYRDMAFDMAIEALEEQRPHGEWITVCTLPIIQKCSKCKYVRKSGVEVYNFCPNCGADMRKEGDNK